MVDIFTINDEEINVEDIMRQIRENIAARRARGEIIDIEDLSLDESPAMESLSGEFGELRNNLRGINNFWDVSINFPIVSHRKVLGPIIVFAKKATRKLLRWLLNPPFEKQLTFNSFVAKTLNEISKKFVEEISSHNQEIQVIKEQQNDLDKQTRELHVLIGDSRNLTEDVRQIRCLIDGVQQNIQETSSTEGVKSIIDRLEILEKRNSEITIVNERLWRIERWLRREGIDVEAITKLPQEQFNVNETINIDYFLFEQRFRGSREEIKERQKIYLDYFKGKSNVLDFGCGRGEFVELLMENGKEAIGIDINDDMVAYCQDRGLPVELRDGFEYLNSLPEASLGGIFLGQVVEHLSPNRLIELLNVAREKLKPGAYLIAETVNPQCLTVFAQSFYMDLSHVRPVHPLTIHFLMETAGYRNLKFEYSSPVPTEVRIPCLKGTDIAENLEEFNQGIIRLNDLLFGFQDYAIIGQR